MKIIPHKTIKKTDDNILFWKHHYFDPKRLQHPPTFYKLDNTVKNFTFLFFTILNKFPCLLRHYSMFLFIPIPKKKLRILQILNAFHKRLNVSLCISVKCNQPFLIVFNFTSSYIIISLSTNKSNESLFIK